MIGHEIKVFDPADGFAPLRDLIEITDGTIAWRDGRWWFYGAGQMAGFESTQLFSASLAPGHSLAATGWQVTARPEDAGSVAPLAAHERSHAWDLKGGRHCPCWVRGFDPERNTWVERIYYAGSAGHLWGPYSVGYLEWDGTHWVDQPEPVFVATEPWELNSVFEPNLIYADGLWKMWFVAGSNFQNSITHGYAESADGRTNWSEHRIFAPAEQKIFDFSVRPSGNGYEGVFSRVSLAAEQAPPDTGLWWCRADAPHPELSAWSEPVHILTAEDRGWRSGPWKPSLQFDPANPDAMFVFFAGTRRTNDPGPFPFVFTQGCLQIERPALVRRVLSGKTSSK